MKTRILLSLIAFTSAVPGQCQDRLDDAFKLLRDAVDRGDVPGCIALVARNGKLLRHEAIGLSDLENQRPFNTNTLCWIASVTKPVTVAAAMTLVDAGKLALDDPVEKYLPDFRGQTDTNGIHHAVTIRHLMTHTSGLAANPPTRKSVDVIGGALTDDWLSQKLPDIVAAIAKSRLLFQPGSKTQYSNAAFFVLGRVIEIISGQSYPEYVKRKILEPLGMRDSHYAPPPTAAGRVSPIYSERKGERTAIFRFNRDLKILNTPPDGGLFSYPSELARFLQMFLDDDGKVLSNASVEVMLKEQFPGWGLGWALEGGQFVHSGSSGTVVWGDRKTGVIGILFMQYRDDRNQGAQLQKGFRQAVQAAFP